MDILLSKVSDEIDFHADSTILCSFCLFLMSIQVTQQAMNYAIRFVPHYVCFSVLSS